jgi:hypothetical protein
LLIGDLNAYPQEDPVRVFTQAGFTDEIDRRSPDAHTYVYAGASGRLDHALASPELTGQVSGAAVWAINADETPWLDYNREFKAPERRCGMGRRQTCATDTYTPTPWRSSDHDPVIVGLDL